MRTDARSIFVVSLLLFVAVTGWRLWVHLQPAPEPEPTVKATGQPPVKPSTYRQLGIINFVSNQFAAQTLIVPVKPFRPTFEAMVQNPASGDLQQMLAGAQGTGPRWGGERPDRGGRRPNWSGRGGEQSQEGGQRSGQGSGTATADSAPPGAARYAYKGVFERPDGRMAAYVSSSSGGGRFLTKGARLEGAEVVAADATGVVLRLSDGREIELRPGQPGVALGAGQE